MAHTPRAQVGDLVVIAGQRLGEPSRTGEILELLGTSEHGRYRVRWDDGHESIFTPNGDAVIRHGRDADDERVLVHEP